MAIVYVNELGRHKYEQDEFGDGAWCHLFSEDEAALHQFAKRLGINSAWLRRWSDAKFDHYVLDPAKRREAVALGAVEVRFPESRRIWERINAAPGPIELE